MLRGYVGSAKEEYFRTEKGLEQSMVGAGFFSIISKMMSRGSHPGIKVVEVPAIRSYGLDLIISLT